MTKIACLVKKSAKGYADAIDGIIEGLKYLLAPSDAGHFAGVSWFASWIVIIICAIYAYGGLWLATNNGGLTYLRTIILPSVLIPVYCAFYICYVEVKE